MGEEGSGYGGIAQLGRAQLALGKLNSALKRACIHLFATGAEHVIDLGCGRGGDVNKWLDAAPGLREYVGCDLSCDCVRNTQKRMREQSQKVSSALECCVYVAIDLCSLHSMQGSFIEELRAVMERTGCEAKRIPRALTQGFDVASSQLAMHYAFGTEREARGWLRAGSCMLREGGVYVITTVNGPAIVQSFCRKMYQGYQETGVVPVATSIGGLDGRLRVTCDVGQLEKHVLDNCMGEGWAKRPDGEQARELLHRIVVAHQDREAADELDREGEEEYGGRQTAAQSRGGVQSVRRANSGSGSLGLHSENDLYPIFPRFGGRYEFFLRDAVQSDGNRAIVEYVVHPEVLMELAAAEGMEPLCALSFHEPACGNGLWHNWTAAAVVPLDGVGCHEGPESLRYELANVWLVYGVRLSEALLLLCRGAAENDWEQWSGAVHRSAECQEQGSAGSVGAEPSGGGAIIRVPGSCSPAHHVAVHRSELV